MRTAASSDALRGAIGRARRTDPPSGGLFHVWARVLAGTNAAPYNLHGPVRIPDEFPTVRAPGRAAAAASLLPAVLRRGAAGQGRRSDTTREFESVSRVADVLSRPGDGERVAVRGGGGGGARGRPPGRWGVFFRWCVLFFPPPPRPPPPGPRFPRPPG